MPKPTTLPCVDCGDAVPQKPGRGAHRLRCDPCRKQRTSEVQRVRHQAVYVPRRRATNCRHCGQPIPDDRHGSARHCSAECRQAAKSGARVYREPPPHETRRCSWCGHDFPYHPKYRLSYCSRYCRNIARSYDGKADPWPRVSTPRRVTSSNATNSLKVIGDRDGWRCHICGRKVARHDATRDHLIPYTDGGTWQPANLALAHRSCNSRRWTGRIAAQLKLIS